jgi:hypothetical protein
VWLALRHSGVSKLCNLGTKVEAAGLPRWHTRRLQPPKHCHVAGPNRNVSSQQDSLPCALRSADHTVTKAPGALSVPSRDAVSRGTASRQRTCVSCACQECSLRGAGAPSRRSQQRAWRMAAGGDAALRECQLAPRRCGAPRGGGAEWAHAGGWAGCDALSLQAVRARRHHRQARPAASAAAARTGPHRQRSHDWLTHDVTTNGARVCSSALVLCGPCGSAQSLQAGALARVCRCPPAPRPRAGGQFQTQSLARFHDCSSTLSANVLLGR